eukprot:6189796-Pleurochrysis_carterae.AAC.2
MAHTAAWLYVPLVWPKWPNICVWHMQTGAKRPARAASAYSELDLTDNDRVRAEYGAEDDSSNDGDDDDDDGCDEEGDADGDAEGMKPKLLRAALMLLVWACSAAIDRLSQHGRRPRLLSASRASSVAFGEQERPTLRTSCHGSARDCTMKTGTRMCGST